MKKRTTKRIHRLTQSSSSILTKVSEGLCDACGGYGVYRYMPIISSTLAKQWSLSKTQRDIMSSRESMFCMYCGCSYRLRLLARVVNRWIGEDLSRSLLQNINEGKYNHLEIAEINSCGVLHEILQQIPSLNYSEYKPPNASIDHQDIQKLSYTDNSLDLVLTSDVLEHVPNVEHALSETFRVLKPGGVHIMTVPVLMDRITKQRAYMDNDNIIYDNPPSFHDSGEPDYLVWREFGVDFIEIVKSVGFDAYYLFENKKNINDVAGVVLAYKPNSFNQTEPSVPYRDDAKLVFDLSWQLNRNNILAEKIKLTQNHADNLEVILEDIKLKYEKMMRIVQEKDNELKEMNAIIEGTFFRKLKRLFNR